MSTPPLCLWCQQKPVKKGYGVLVRSECHRPTEGKGRWRNFCSRECAGEHAQASLTPEHRARTTQNIVNYNKRKSAQTIAKAIKAAFRETGIVVPLPVAIQIYRTGYVSGYRTGHQAVMRQRERERIA